MIRIGLTGGIGSGKTTVSDLFAELGVPVIDTDIIARHLVDNDPEILAAIRDTFGDEVIAADGRLDRQQLAAIVFRDADKKHQLESILHPAIRRIVLQQADSHAGSAHYVILVVPLLFETDFQQLVDRKLVVTADEAVRGERVQQRDGRHPDEIRAIMAQQLDDTTRSHKADDIIDNNGDIRQLTDRVRALHAQYSSL